MAELLNRLVEQLQDAKSAAAALLGILASAIVTAVFRHIGKPTRDWKRNEESIGPTAPQELTDAKYQLELETWKVRAERAEWANTELQRGNGLLQRDLDRTAAELIVVREKLQSYQLVAEQKEERFRASETTERVKIPKLPPPKQTPPRRPQGR